MAQDIGLFHESPMIVTLKFPGQCSQTDNNRPKQHPPHQYPPCTTQATPPAMTSDQAGPLGGCLSPSQAATPCKAEDLSGEDSARRSTNSGLGPSSGQHGDTSASQQDPILKGQVPEQDHYSDDLQLRIRDMWPSRPGDSDDYHQRNGNFQSKDSETKPASPFSQLEYIGQNIKECEELSSLPRNWTADSHNLFQQSLAWNNCTTDTRHSLNQSIYYQNRLQLVDQTYSINSPASFGSGMGTLEHPFHQDNPNYVNLRSNTDSFQEYTANTENAPITTLPHSTDFPLYEATAAMCQDRKDMIHLDEGEMDPDYQDDGWWQDSLLADSPSSIEAPGSKVDEPYAQLIYRAFMSRPDKSMTLQEIYQWFRENTDKSKSEGKGWQNSIRHNLSMNGAFTKRNSKAPLSGNGDGSVSLDNTGVDSRKSTEWFLEPAFYAGVESTTRYRKGNSGGRSRGIGSHSGRSRIGSDGHGTPGSGFSHARVSAGRKGGNVAAQNRKRLAERQQQARQTEMTRAHPRHLQQHRGYHGQAGVPYAAYEETSYYPHYPTPHLAPSPFISGFGGVPAVNMHEQRGARQTTGLLYSCVKPDDVGRDAGAKHNRQMLGAQNDDEPTTPVDSSLTLPRSAGFGSKQGDMLPEVLGSYNPLNSYQVGLGLGHHQQQPDGYPSVVTGIYESPAGAAQPPLFISDDINLSPEDALMMNLNFGE